MSESTRIASIKVEDRHRKEYGDLGDLAKSIKELGVLQPVLITPDMRLIAGERRIKACRNLGMETIPARVVSHLVEAADLLRAERDENTCRQEMTVSEKVSLARAIEAMERPKAAERQAAQAFGRGVDNSGPRGPELKKELRADGIASEAVGMSRKTYQRAKYVTDTANDEEQPPEVRKAAKDAVDAMDRGEMSIKNAQRTVNEKRGVPPETVSRNAPKPKSERLTRPQPPKYGGNRRKHAQVIAAMNTTLHGLAIAAAEITEFDNTVTPEEAARLRDDLSGSLKKINQLKQMLNRKATS